MKTLNDITPNNYARQPRGRCLLNGREMVGWISMEVDNNTFSNADTFSVLFAQKLLPEGYGIDWFARQKSFRVEVQFDDGVTGLRSFVLGDADSLNFDPTARTVRLEGRDLTAVLIDEKTTKKWQNLTASAIATIIAKKHHLTPVVTPTKAKAGSYYQIDHVKLQDEQSEWDLLTYLAQREEFVCYVRGNALHFEPMPTPETADRYRLDWSETSSGPLANVISLHFERALTVSKGVIVQVNSFNAKAKKGFHVSYPREPSKGKTSAGKAKPQAKLYRYTFPNMTHEQALAKAQALHRQIIQHEMKLSGTLPADNLLMPEVMIDMTGTGSQFDQAYYVDSVRRSMDISNGYRMDVTAKNHNPNTDKAEATS